MRQKGITPIIVLVVIGVLILLGSAGAYYYLKMSGKSPFEDVVINYSISPTLPWEAEISDNDDSETLESELNATEVDSIDADIDELESSASSL